MSIVEHMLDEELRNAAKPLYKPLTRSIARRFSANSVTLCGLAAGAACLVCVASGANGPALVLWLLNRLLDGLDGEVARLRSESSEAGAYLDIVADFVLYGGLLVALAVQHPDARLSLCVLFFAYYLNGSVFLALSSVLERIGANRETERGLHFRRSLTEGFETVVYGVLVLALPQYISVLTWIFAAMVFVSVVQRLMDARRLLAGR